MNLKMLQSPGESLVSSVTRAALPGIAGILILAGASRVATAQALPYATRIEPAVASQTLPEDRGATGLWQTLRKLNTRASLMTIVAHPDDEDGGTLTYESRGAGVRTSLLTLTRGEGGQNAMSSESDDALGLIRTQELLRADQYYASQQYWSRVADFGFSKTIEEAFDKWGHDRVLYDAVRVVRIDRPLVITSTFVGGITDGHGQHQVSGAMAQEVFAAAGDPTVFPDQIAAGLRPWSPLKVYSRTPFFSLTAQGMFDYATGKWAPVRFYNYIDKTWTNQGLPLTVEVPAGTWDPVLGRSYAQIARQGWSEQRSQNSGGFRPLAGPVSVTYHRFASRVKAGDPKSSDSEKSFFDGIDVSLPGIASLAHGENPWLVDGLEQMRQHVVNAMLGYVPSAPEKIAPELHDGYLRTKKLMEDVKRSTLTADEKADIDHELAIKLVQFNTALAEAFGLEVQALVTPDVEAAAGKAPTAARALSLAPEQTLASVTPGQEFRVRVHISAANPKAKLKKTWISSPEEEHWRAERMGAPGLDDPLSTSGDVTYRVAVPLKAAPTQPYFTRQSIEQPYYDLADPRWQNESFAPWPLAGWAEFDYDGVPIQLASVVETVHQVQGPGTVFEPLIVTPGVSVRIDPAVGVVLLPDLSAKVEDINRQGKDFAIHVVVRSDLAGKTNGHVKLELPPNWTSIPAEGEFTTSKAGEEADVNFSIHPAALASELYTIKAVAQSGNYRYSSGYQTVGYKGLQPYNLYRPATYKLRGVDVKVAPGLRVGYVMGTGDEVPLALESLGITPHLLGALDLESGDLSAYNTIIVGIRAYSTRPDLVQWNRRLLDYVHSGGCVVVQYESNDYDHNYGPFPYQMGQSPERVVDEKAPVKILLPDSPLLNWPNHITSADFDNWVEERGHSFLKSWDSHYSALTETHDEGQDPQQGGLVAARSGKGLYIYMAFAVYRQLPEAVPGAYRLLANLVSVGKNPVDAAIAK